ncbi:4Fe-4S binding protein [Pseudodesulfovibrio sp. JC047]|uniref:4Fe-4S binding protein n=1 Tax=Pseudodesulfovibrio sp. JC047 TaxID=2683199 RepID=UPI0013D24004|nr:4Fe-4S binding protein [Pseudodesulfovibrio sp. JC047]NDV18450.1 4Fe-4S binding protein [Pseudodesulfovibrio sp. JC047]
MKLHRNHVRRACQCLVALSFIAIPWINGFDIRIVTGNLLSLEIFGIPFADPLAALQVFFSTWSLSWTVTIGALLSLTLAVIMGPVFCSWICPYGLIADLMQKLPFVKRRNRFSRGWLFKAVVVGIVVVGLGAMAFPPMLNQLSLPGWYTRTMQTLWLSGTIPAGFWLLPAASVLDMAGGGHFWCRYCCPQSLLLQAAGLVLPRRFRVKYDASKCICSEKNPSPCMKSCPYGLDPRERKIHPECTNCGDCVVQCSHFGSALSQGFGSRK